MSRKLFLILAVFVFVFSVFQPNAGARWRLKHADRNKDVAVDKKEKIMEKKWEHKQRSDVNTWWERIADANSDGKVDAAELSAWNEMKRKRIDLNGDGIISSKEKRLCWRNARSKVNTSLETKYDENGNGWLEPEEAAKLVRDRYTLVKTKGKAKVDSALEEEYDTDKDGIISPEEAETMKSDLGD